LEVSYCYDQGIPHSEFLEWSDEDRAKILAYKLNEAERCSSCGTTQFEWEENQKAYAPTERFCPGCYLREVASEDVEGLPGTTITLIPTTSFEYQKRLYEMKKDWAQKSKSRET
jgi:hypothetical protein